MNVNYSIKTQGGVLIEDVFSQYQNEDVVCIVINTKTKYPKVACYTYGGGEISLQICEYSYDFDPDHKFEFTTIILNEFITNWRVFSSSTGRYEIYVTFMNSSISP